MSHSGATSGGGGSSNYSYASSGQSSNYNYLSFFATGSFGRRLEGQRSRDPSAPGQLAEEKRKWKWIAGVAIASMFLMNVLAAIGLSQLKNETFTDEVGIEGDLQTFIQQEMKNSLGKHCQPRYRETQECSQVSSQLVLVTNSDKDTVVWRDGNSILKDYNQTTPGAFFCKGIKPDAKDGRLKVLSDGVYQIHSHVSVRKLARGVTFQHEIRRKRIEWGPESMVAEETLSRYCNTASDNEACFSSSLLATEHLEVGDVIFVHFQINGEEFDPKVKRDFLVHDGRSTYFGVVKLGVIKP